MRIAICEDEHIYLELIKNKVVEYFKERQVSINTDSYTDASLLSVKIDEGKQYDLILMDLQMKHSDGMEIAKELRAKSVDIPIIFVTGIENRAYQGYSVDALDYVVKKDMETRLPEALDRFLERQKSNTIAVPEKKEGTVIIKVKNILWVESEGRGSKFMLKRDTGGVMETATKEIVSSLPINKVSEILSKSDFVEIYKSIFVNIREIKRVGNDNVVMSDDQKLPLSRR
ncbi:MAG: LytTR family DNA-binding domain-containing protein, partial [Lachnospiraceae bacterium]|nr:LytTR family DNA-binding domain-containing protein [Lachnospiraceae bacterium]